MATKLSGGPICQIASCEGSKKLCVPIGIWAFLCPQNQQRSASAASSDVASPFRPQPLAKVCISFVCTI